ncbi:MAG TPA: tryptophan synthase subunit beta [Candidatus Rikenella faecigallinarum]|uniref:Tryptophan synthase beta chain n=1 Tax=Candidatus Rikenella faecigallinarum TaxID=2838745 RepID=A0A9D1QB60_9BACT|nr:tryptophan synthase subunit beta [Candidatus Rikenella faecigallinarum]
MKYNPDKNGYYGEFGGAFIPDELREDIGQLTDRYVEIIESPKFQAEFSDLLKNYAGRPSPLTFAPRLSERYGARIYLKREDLNHTGSHKINNAIGQILLAREMGCTHIIAETGAGQHGVATATVCAKLGLKCTIYMGAVDVERQALNVARMKMLGAEVVPVTQGGATLKDAVDVALDYWVSHPEAYYLLGSAVGPHPFPDIVARLQSVISREIRSQLEEQEGHQLPDYVIACIGGGSNAIGAFYHFLEDDSVRLIQVEAGGHGTNGNEHAASLTCGREGILHGSRSMILFDEKGEVREPYSISAGLDYPGIGPLHAYLAQTGRSTVLVATDRQALEAAHELALLEGIIPAIESAHALAALPQLTFKPNDVVVVNLSGRGDKDMPTYLRELHL